MFRRKPKNTAVASESKPFPTDTKLVDFDNGDFWTLRNAFEGLHVFGGVGSGKTSGTGYNVAKAFLENGYGGLVLTAKGDETETWLRYAAETNRSDDVILFNENSNFCFNFLDYERTRGGRGGGESDTILQLFKVIIESFSGKSGGGGDDRFWQDSAENLIRNAIDLLLLADKPVTIDQLTMIVKNTPFFAEGFLESWLSGLEENAKLTEEHGKDLDPDNLYKIEDYLSWTDPEFKKLLGAAEELSSRNGKQREFKICKDYFCTEFSVTPEKTRNTILAVVYNIFNALNRGVLYKLFSGDESKEALDPRACFDNKIIILDLPVLEFREVGRLAQIIFKYVWQRVTLQRVIPKLEEEMHRPVFLWVDEAQHFITPFEDEFLSTCRSFRVCSVYMTQNYNNYLSRLRGQSNAKPSVDAFLGNMQTFIFHANSDAVTNQWAATQIARNKQKRVTKAYGGNSGSQEAGQKNKSSSSFNRTESEEILYQVLPYDFTQLRKGGEKNNYLVEAYIIHTGTNWATTGANYRSIELKQG